MLHRIVRWLRPGSSVGLPKGIFTAARRQAPPIRVAPLLLETSPLTPDGVYERLRTRAAGLTTDEAEARLEEYGPNIVHVIGTQKIPFVQSRASPPLVAMTVLIMSIGVLIPLTPLGRYLGFVPLPPLYWVLLTLTLLAYMLLTQTVKTWLIRRAWIRLPLRPTTTVITATPTAHTSRGPSRAGRWARPWR